MSEDESTKNVAATPPPRTKKPAKAQDVPDASAARQSAAERTQQKLEERVRPHIEQLAAAEPSAFQRVLDASIRKLTNERARREDRYHLLGAALRRIPTEMSGLVVVKHFKMGSEWTKAEIESALNAVTAAVGERTSEVGQMGPIVHGTLVSLVDAARKQEALDGSGGEQVDLIAALVRLHNVTWHPDREPLKGIPENPTAKVLSQASELLFRYANRADVQGISGQRLFGFGSVFVAQPPSESMPQVDAPPLSVRPRPASEPDVSRDQQGPEAKSAPAGDSAPAAQPTASITEDLLRKEVALLERKLDLSKRENSNLRRDCTREREQSSDLRRQLKVLADVRDGLSDRVMDLQAKLEVAAELEAQLSAQSVVNRAANEEIDRLRESLRISEAQARSAMESEFERGKTVSRFTVAKYFVEPLRQISDVASTVEGDSGQFIRDMANSLRKYLEEGRG